MYGLPKSVCVVHCDPNERLSSSFHMFCNRVFVCRKLSPHLGV